MTGKYCRYTNLLYYLQDLTHLILVVTVPAIKPMISLKQNTNYSGLRLESFLISSRNVYGFVFLVHFPLTSHTMKKEIRFFKFKSAFGNHSTVSVLTDRKQCLKIPGDCYIRLLISLCTQISFKIPPAFYFKEAVCNWLCMSNLQGRLDHNVRAQWIYKYTMRP